MSTHMTRMTWWKTPILSFTWPTSASTWVAFKRRPKPWPSSRYIWIKRLASGIAFKSREVNWPRSTSPASQACKTWAAPATWTRWCRCFSQSPTPPTMYASDVNRGEYLQRRVALDSSSDFIFQISKLANGLLSGQNTAKPLDDTIKSRRGIKPNSFKLLVERGHLESGTKRQQDAHEFLMHLLKLCQQNSRTDLVRSTVSPVDSLKFRIEERIQCCQSNCVKYTNRDEFCLSLPISRYLAVNKEQVS